MAEDVSTSASPPAAPASGVVVPNRPSFFQRCVARFIWLLIRVVSGTLRYHWTDHAGEINGPGIYALWHNRLALSLEGYFAHARRRKYTAGLTVLISASKDGGFLSGIFDCFHVKTARGSSSRRGRQALLELTRAARRGSDLGLTPDGPRGPRYVVQDGVIYLAQLTGFPIIPMTYKLGWKITIRSWDRFLIPLPFSRCEMIYGKAIHVPREATDEQREALRLELENSLKELSGY